jgi:hypothetical protein
MVIRLILPHFTQTFSGFMFLFYYTGNNGQWIVYLIFPQRATRNE